RAGRKAARHAGTASAEDLKREPWRAAAPHQRGDLVPVDVVGGCLGKRPWDPQPSELRHPPLVHQQVLVVDRPVACCCRRWFHRWGPSVRPDSLVLTLRSPGPGPNPQLLLVLARDLLALHRDLTAAG